MNSAVKEVAEEETSEVIEETVKKMTTQESQWYAEELVVVLAQKITSEKVNNEHLRCQTDI